MSKLTSLSATTPPKRRVTWSTSRRTSPTAPEVSIAILSWSEVSLSSSAPTISCSGICGSLLGLVSSVFDLCGSPSARHQALGPEDHHQHERQAEGERAPLLELTEPLGEVGEQE